MKKSELEIESESVKNSLKRIHIGGLTPNITKKELKEKFSSFGKVQDVEIKIKKDMDGEVFNTFAYIDIDAEDSSIQKCFSIFNKAKWKGRTLQLQVAKQHFLTRLEKERNTPEVTKVKKVKTSFHDPLANLTDVEDFNVKGKVPGTAIPGEKKWIVGKYGRVLPIVNVRDKTTNRVSFSN
ncbi:hypothetical protein SNE40_015052 [Patella caerulea]|uniref:RRM domain-containing protein n=1 Tax=Patella caerulea TaxID=87958 RepID=A0AAN8JLD0_PATCE